jgi:hypothetical protein
MRVPEYQPGVQIRPEFQSSIEDRSTPGAFGASIGRGMQDAARGLDQMGDALAAVAEMEGTLRAKERDNQFAAWDREAKYGEGGFLTLEGKAAVDGRAAYEKNLVEKQREFGKGLDPIAGGKYKAASDARVSQSLDGSIRHAASARKQWFADATTARLNTFAEEAVAAYSDPAKVQFNIAGGQAEIREQARMLGWDADVLKNREAEYISSVRMGVAARLLGDDPLKAKAYYDQHKGQLTGPHQAKFEEAIKVPLKTEHVKQHTARILGAGRQAAPAASGGGGQPAQAGRTLASAGPTQARAFLISRAPRGAYSVDSLDEAFATNLATMIQDAPPSIRDGLGITSGHRSREHQERLFRNSDGSGRMVARPGRSNHEVRADGTAKAVDLNWNGQRLDKAPKEVVDWVHKNAGNYGMYFPMSWEKWHIEPQGTRGGDAAGPGSSVRPRGPGVAGRVGLPSTDQIEEQLAQIPDLDERELTRKAIYGQIEAQGKMEAARQKEIRAQAFSLLETENVNPFNLDPTIKAEIGIEGMNQLMSYWEKRSTGEAIQSDETLLYDMKRYAATNPNEFAAIDLTHYMDKLSKQDIRALGDLQTSALKDEQKARTEGLNITAAINQAEPYIRAAGIQTGNSKEAQKDAEKVARINLALIAEMEAFQRQNERVPNQVEIQGMIKKQLLGTIVKPDAGSSWNPLNWFGGQRKQFWFETDGVGDLADGTRVEIDVDYDKIPLRDRIEVEVKLTEALGRKPSKEEVEEFYGEFLYQNVTR